MLTSGGGSGIPFGFFDVGVNRKTGVTTSRVRVSNWVPPGTTLKPAGWTPINVCDFVSNGRRTRCERDGLAMDQLAQYLEYGVVEIWTSPANSRFGPSRKWATAPLFLDE